MTDRKTVFCLIIGGGISAVTLAAQICDQKSLKPDQFRVLDEGPANRYWRSTCDLMPSWLKCSNARLNSIYLSGDLSCPQQHYADIVAQYKLEEHTVYNTQVISAAWNDRAFTYDVVTVNIKTGIETAWIANVVINTEDTGMTSPASLGTEMRLLEDGGVDNSRKLHYEAYGLTQSHLEERPAIEPGETIYGSMFSKFPNYISLVSHHKPKTVSKRISRLVRLLRKLCRNGPCGLAPVDRSCNDSEQSTRRLVVILPETDHHLTYNRLKGARWHLLYRRYYTWRLLRPVDADVDASRTKQEGRRISYSGGQLGCGIRSNHFLDARGQLTYYNPYTL